MMPERKEPRAPAGQVFTIRRWPTERWPEGLGLSVKDGWNFGLGLGLAMTIALPLILAAIACLVGLGVVILGGSLGALLQ